MSQSGRASTRIRLLASIREVFPEDDDRIVCQELANALNSLEEEAWGGWNDGSGITTREIGKHLSHFHVIARKWRDGNRTVRGYEREQFTDLWPRYLSVSGLSNRHTATTRMDSGITADHKPPQNQDVAVLEIDKNPHEYSDVAVVAVSERENSERALIEEASELVEERVLIPLDLGTATLDELKEFYGLG